MTYLDADDLIRLQELLIVQSDGRHGILDRGKIESAAAQPRMSFGGEELYPHTCGEGGGDGILARVQPRVRGRE